MKTTIAGLALAATCLTAHASTVAEFTSTVNWRGSDHRVLFSGQCTAHFSTHPDAHHTSTWLESFTLSCPGYDDARITIYPNSLATLGTLPARVLRSQPNTIKLETGESETLQFSVDRSKM
ncbi:hypothetical protein [Burkholderia ambifaria]|uniref:hypothetical protein n=1 Tax=Burkholderia ambifaria TaxID=152480 RepID=UPI001BA1B3F9|nr:hypothetical protein [Burkholderia ambifaria]MBR8254343.1 hypothetical protein [Burkholderia ambifaria]